MVFLLLEIMIKKYILLLILAVLFVNINAQERFNKQNFSELYNINGVNLHPKFSVYHNSDTTSTLFYQIDNSELLYKKDNYNIDFAKASIHYEIYYNYKAKLLVDSGTFVYTDTDNYGLNNSSFGYFHLPIIEDYNYLLYIEFKDDNKNYFVRKLIDIDKTDIDSRQNYYTKDNDQLPVLVNYLNKDDNFTIVSERNNNTNIKVRIFKPNIRIPKPPMVNNTNKIEGLIADTLHKLPMQNGESNPLQLSDQGFYHFYNNDEETAGYTLYRFTNDYPYITTPMQMIMPLRYISSSKEFKTLYNSKNKKKAVEDFWINISGDEKRAKNMIKLYYNRVQNSNISFAADREGWMTDRGMIFIIYGPADVVYRNGNMETWKYGNYKNDNALVFNFYKVDNPFTDNLYIMQRSEEYKPSWNKAIEVWRR